MPEEEFDRVEISGGNLDSNAANSGIQASLSGRYATALFELARDARAIEAVEAVEASLATVRQALAESDDFHRLTTSPLVARDNAVKAIDAVAATLKLDSTTRNFLGVLAQNRRLRDLPAIIRSYRDLAARHRGEITAEVTSAHPLTDDQVADLKQALRQRVGREVNVDLAVDSRLLGGLVVKIGSQRIDSSIKTRLNSLAHAMRG